MQLQAHLELLDYQKSVFTRKAFLITSFLSALLHLYLAYLINFF